jgi:hypothetical protein
VIQTFTATVWCGQCGHGQKLERPVAPTEKFYVLCHKCEAVLSVEVPGVKVPTISRMPAWLRGILK